MIYEYEDQLRAHMGCRQIRRCHNENHDYIYGATGTGLIVNNRVFIEGDKPWAYQGPANNMYQTEHDELFAAIRRGEPINDGPSMANSTMMAIMGRMAAYTGREITWEEALNSTDVLVPDPLEWDQELPIRPMAMPGVTPFI